MPTARAEEMSTLKMPPGCELVPTSLLLPPVRVGANNLDADMTQVDNELAGKGKVDEWEVDRIVGAHRLDDGSCRYAVVWAKDNPKSGGTWATAEELGLQEPRVGSEAGNDMHWHRHFGTGIASSQRLLVQWEIEDDEALPAADKAKRKQPSTRDYSFWATTGERFSSSVLRNSHLLQYKKQRVKYTKLSAAPGAKPVHVQTHGTQKDTHWLNMWTLEAERDSTNTTGSVSYSLGSSGGKFALKSWLLEEFAGYRFISKDTQLGLEIKTR